MILGSTGLESSPDGTGNIGGIINGDIVTINEIFNLASGLTASQSGATVTASAAVFISDMVGATIQWGDGSNAVITGFTSSTVVTVGVTQTIAAQTFEVFRTDQTNFTALARGLVKKSRILTADDAKHIRWSDALQQFVLYGGFATITYAGTVNLDLSVGGLQTVSLTGNITFTSGSYAGGRSMTVRIKADSSTRNLNFPGWTFVGATAPANIAANKSAILKLNCFGTTAADVLAEYAVQP